MRYGEFEFPCQGKKAPAIPLQSEARLIFVSIIIFFLLTCLDCSLLWVFFGGAVSEIRVTQGYISVQVQPCWCWWWGNG